MADKGEQSRTAEGQDDSFEGLLKRAAYVSTPSMSSLASQLNAGSTLLGGRLRVTRRIGEGGMGVVYEAHDERRRGAVALKTLSRLDASNVYRLKNEFRSLADVSHPSLVRLHELFGEGEQWFFTMELVDGVRLDRWVRPDGKLDEARLRAALPQLVAAIEAIHAAGKLHRDLKPSNVLVTAEGRVVALDFGLAVDPELGGVGQTLLDDGVSGTPAYMAPEQAAGSPATAASDFYALGVMLFEALTGKLPFEGRAHDMLVDKQRMPAPTVAQRCPDAPEDLSTLCEELLRREPTARPGGLALRARLGVPDDATASGASTWSQAPRGVTPPRAQATRDRELLLGREPELASLRDAYAATLTGQAVVVFVSGESGMGKSALVAQFLDELRAQGEAAVLAGRCYERESVPFKGIDSMVDDLSRFLRKLPREEAVALMPREVYAVARVFPVLGRIDAVAQAPKKDIVDAQELRQRAFTAFGELLARIRDRRPLVLYIDDAQWLDRDAVTFLGYLLGHHDPAAMLLLLSHRSEGAADSSLLAQVRQHVNDNARLQQRELLLGPLPPDAAQALAARLLVGQSAARAAEVAAESSGSPFFVGELSRQARRSGEGSRLTLHEALLAHVQGLPLGARYLLEVLALAGRPLPLDLALDASAASHEHIDLLHGERLLRGSSGGDERSLECYHDKIRESVTQALSAERARAVHASLLAVLVDRGDADAEHLALHAQGAGDREAAARYAAQAALLASQSMAFERAALLYGRALEFGDHDGDARRDLRTRLGEALANAGRGADAARMYLEAAEGAAMDHALDLKRRAAEQLLISGRIDDGKALLDEVLRAVGLSLPGGPKRALLALGVERARLRLRGLAFRERNDALPAKQQRELDVLWSAARGLSVSDMFTGAALISRYARLALASGVPEHAAQALASEASFASGHAGLSAKTRSDALLDRAQKLAVRSASPYACAWVELCWSTAAWLQGNPEGCAAHSKQAIQMLRDRCSGVTFESGGARMGEQNASMLLGDFAAAAELTSLIDEAWRRGDSYTAIALTGSSAPALLVHGDVEGVQRLIEQARRHWTRQRVYAIPDWQILFAETMVAAYLGDPRRAFELMQADWPAFTKGQYLRTPFMQDTARGLRGSIALAVARLGGAEAPAARALARGDADALARIRTPLGSARSRVLYAVLAFDDGHLEHAVGYLRAALTAFDAAGTRTWATAVRRLLGRLLGGAEGSALVAQADADWRGMGAVDLEATTRMFGCGLDVG